MNFGYKTSTFLEKYFMFDKKLKMVVYDGRQNMKFVTKNLIAFYDVFEHF